MASRNKCSRCGRPWSLYDGPCNRCLKGMAATRSWVKKFQRSLAAKKAAKTRAARNKKMVLGVAQ